MARLRYRGIFAPPLYSRHGDNARRAESGMAMMDIREVLWIRFLRPAGRSRNAQTSWYFRPGGFNPPDPVAENASNAGDGAVIVPRC